jgi:hypothetical protein
MQFFTEFETKVKAFLALLIKLTSGKAKASETRPRWTKVLAMEIMRGCVSTYISTLKYRFITHMQAL